MMWYEKILAAHLDVTDQVSHIERMHSDRYFVWQEDGENVLAADDSHAERAVTGTTDLFTKQEFDPWVDAFGEARSAATALRGRCPPCSTRRTPALCITNGRGRWHNWQSSNSPG